MLETVRIIQIPDSTDTSFDHGAFDASTRKVFLAHTARSRLEVIDHDAGRHLATIEGFPGAAGVVAHKGQVLVTNRGSAELAWLDARTLETQAVFATGPQPNGVAITPNATLAVVACIGDERRGPELHVFNLETKSTRFVELPGRPRWCVTDAEGRRVFVAIREPSMVFVAELPELAGLQQWALPAGGAHGIDIDHGANQLYVACDAGALIELSAVEGGLRRTWPLPGVPDATFFNPASGCVHVAIDEPGVIVSIDMRTGSAARFQTASGAKTTALVAPNRLYVFSPTHGGALDLVEA